MSIRDDIGDNQERIDTMDLYAFSYTEVMASEGLTDSERLVVIAAMASHVLRSKDDSVRDDFLMILLEMIEGDREEMKRRSN